MPQTTPAADFKMLGRDQCSALVTALASAPAKLANDESAHLILLWVNLDRFQQINQSIGYAGGDMVIQEIATRLYACCGGEAHYGKVGADEFLIILSDADIQTAVMLAQQLMHSIEEPIAVDTINLYPSAAIGIAEHEPLESGDAVILRADQAMRVAKQLGSKRWVVSGYEPEALYASRTELAREELDIESKLHLAIKNGGLRLHYQPILRTDGSIEAVEALMRCTVNGEDISPAKFIPVAEKTGLIIRLGEWTLTQGALFARQLRDAGFLIKVAVNVSRAQLLAPHFSRSLYSALIYAQIPSTQLELELTESLFMDMSSTVQENLCNARAAGVGLAIDDFGTGFSCLANLKDIHATKLKLDRTFVVVLPEDTRSFAIVKAMTSLGQELGMTIVAEGVETQPQLESIKAAGVNAVQGYIHAPAMPGETLLSWLRQKHIEEMTSQNDTATQA